MSPYRTTFMCKYRKKSIDWSIFFTEKQKTTSHHALKNGLIQARSLQFSTKFLRVFSCRSSHFYVTEKSTPLQRFYVISDIFRYTCL